MGIFLMAGFMALVALNVWMLARHWPRLAMALTAPKPEMRFNQPARQSSADAPVVRVRQAAVLPFRPAAQGRMLAA